jgi:hypothetical protein
MGLPGVSVAWGLWSGIGMASAGKDAAWAERGLRTVTSAAGFRALERLLDSGAAYAAVLPIDWRRFLAHAPEGLDLSFFSRAAGPDGSSAAEPAGAAGGAIIERLRSVIPAQRRERLSGFLRERINQVLGLDSSLVLDGRRPLKEAGLDSLMAVELRNVLVRATGVPLPATLLFDYPNLDALTGFLMRAWRLEEPAPASPAAQPDRAAPSDDLDLLSDEEAEALLMEELGMTAAGGQR